MPVVPKNTISEPKRVRLPQINMAEPHTAQAMGAVTSALGRRAASIGRLGDLAGASARQTAEMGNQQMKILQAGAAAEQAKWSALGKIGSQMMDFGFKLEAIQERKAYQNARDAQTAFTSALDGIVFGRVDEASGERIPGTIETPYTPGGKDRDPDGPSLATTKAIRELLEQQDTPWANLDARARREFDNALPRIQQEVMRKVYVAEGDQIMKYRQAQEKLAVDTFFSHLGQLGAGMTSADTANWTQAFNDGFNDFIMGQVGQYWDADKKEWINPDVERYVKDTRRDMLETAVAQRVDNWLTMADAEPDQDRREALLTMAEGYAREYKGMDGSPVLSDLAIAGTNKKAEEVRLRAEQRLRAENLREYQQTESQYRDVLFGRAQMTPELQQRMDRLPKEQRFKLESESYALISKIEEGHFAVAYYRWLAERNPENNETGRQFLEQMILAMTSPTAKLKATDMLQKVDAAEKTARNQAEVLLQNETAFKMERMIDMRGYIDASGSYVPMTDAQMASMILDPRITPEKAVALQEKANKKWKREDHEYAKQAVEYLQNEFGADALAEAFSIKGDQFIIEDGEFDFQTGETGWFGRRKTAELRADLIRDVVQAAVDYGRQVKTLDRTGRKPESLQTVIDGILRGPNGILLNEAEIRDNLDRTRQLLDDMDLEYRRQAFEAFSRFPPQDFQQLAPATIED